MSANTLESRKNVQNGVRRLVFCGISILLQLGFFALLLTKLYNWASIIDIVLRVTAFALVLVLYGQNRTTLNMTTPWIILILSFPILGIGLTLLIGLDGGTYKMKKRYAEIDYRLLPMLGKNDEELERLTDKNPRAGSIARYIAKNSKYPVYDGSSVRYFDEAINGLESQLEDLRKAERFIFMEYHAIEDAKAWSRIEAVLAERAAAGVEVRVFYDDMGSIGFINTTFIEKLKAKGIRCRVFNPFAPMVNVFLNNRDHRKITVIDGKIGYTGGYNLADEYFNYTHPYGMWKDTGIRIEGDAVANLTAAFLEMWNAAKDGNRDTDERFEEFLRTERAENPEGFVQPYADIPIDHEKVGEEVYISLINKAERYCYFITPYLIITDEMKHALNLAAKRGVDVRIITPGIPDKKLVYSVTRSFYSELVPSGVRIYEWTPGFCHAKMCVVDDEMATCGTINLDYRSLYHHFENGCFMAHCEAVLKIKEDMLKTMGESREVTDDYAKTDKKRIGQLIMRLFAGLL